MIQRCAVSAEEAYRGVISDANAFNYMLLPELKGEIVKAASQEDYLTCEAALKEVQERYSEEDFKNAVSDYHFVLMQKSRMEKQEQHKCSREIPAGKTSIYAVCGHFGVPMHKVIADEHGNCKLKTTVERERLNPLEETGAAISTSKINLT